MLPVKKRALNILIHSDAVKCASYMEWDKWAPSNLSSTCGLGLDTNRIQTYTSFIGFYIIILISFTCRYTLKWSHNSKRAEVVSIKCLLNLKVDESNIKIKKILWRIRKVTELIRRSGSWYYLSSIQSNSLLNFWKIWKCNNGWYKKFFLYISISHVIQLITF